MLKIKSKQINQAASFTEKRLAKIISLDPTNLEGNPDLVPLLAILQERDDFNVDAENEVIRPVHEELFLVTCKQRPSRFKCLLLYIILSEKDVNQLGGLLVSVNLPQEFSYRKVL